MKKKAVRAKKEGYPPAEVRVLMHAYIEASAERLSKRLCEAWKKQAAAERRSRHGIAV